jgi:SRSO17 transposase
MGWRRSDDSAERFSAYLDEIAVVMEHAARVAPMRDYCSGLLLDCERKSAEPIAAVTAPNATSAKHQSLLHFLAKGDWSDEKVLGKVRDLVLPQMDRHGPIEAWIIDDTRLPKCGSHSVGVSHQYCGQLGKQANCQVAVSLSVANRASSLPVAYRLYLPESWAQDDARRRKAGVPERIEFQTKPKIALQQIEWACAAGLARGVVEMDCAYGSDLSLRRRLTALELTYAVGVWARTLVRKLERGAGRGDAKPVTAAGLAPSLSKRACRSGPGARSPGATAPTHGWSRVSPACGCVPPARARAVRSPRSG